MDLLHFGESYSIIPKELLNVSYSLEDLGILELAWNWSDAVRVVEHLTKHGFAILGGDVYSKNGGRLKTTIDSWYINKDDLTLWEDYVQKSKHKAISYITSYKSTNGEDFYYAPVFTKFNPVSKY